VKEEEGIEQAGMLPAEIPDHEYADLTLMMVSLGDGVSWPARQKSPEFAARALASYSNELTEILTRHHASIYSVFFEQPLLAIWTGEEIESNAMALGAAKAVLERSRQWDQFNVMAGFSAMNLAISIARGPCIFLRQRDKFINLLGVTLKRVEGLYKESARQGAVWVDPEISKMATGWVSKIVSESVCALSLA
jgi:hypothetical protein